METGLLHGTWNHSSNRSYSEDHSMRKSHKCLFTTPSCERSLSFCARYLFVIIFDIVLNIHNILLLSHTAFIELFLLQKFGIEVLLCYFFTNNFKINLKIKPGMLICIWLSTANIVTHLTILIQTYCHKNCIILIRSCNFVADNASGTAQDTCRRYMQLPARVLPDIIFLQVHGRLDHCGRCWMPQMQDPWERCHGISAFNIKIVHDQNSIMIVTGTLWHEKAHVSIRMSFEAMRRLY